MSEKDAPRRRGGSKKKLDVEGVKAALDASGGIMTATARRLGVDRGTVYRFLDANPDLKTYRADVEEQLKDLAEGKILTAINNGEMDTVRWYADRKMRDRGYGHRSEMSGPKGGPIQFENPTIDPKKMSTQALRELQAAMVAQDPADAE